MSDLRNLSETLTELQLFGAPSLSYHYRHMIGWYCSIDLNVTVPGMSGKIASEWKHRTPDSAARECLDRVRLAFKVNAVPLLEALR